MWVSRGGDFLTHPGRYGGEGRDQSPRDVSLPFRVTADGAPARAPPSQWAQSRALLRQRCSGRWLSPSGDAGRGVRSWEWGVCMLCKACGGLLYGNLAGPSSNPDHIIQGEVPPNQARPPRGELNAKEVKKERKKERKATNLFELLNLRWLLWLLRLLRLLWLLWLPWLLWLLFSFCSFCGFSGWGVYAHSQGRSSGVGPVPLLLSAVFLGGRYGRKG
jgi:hypothetical protein